MTPLSEHKRQLLRDRPDYRDYWLSLPPTDPRHVTSEQAAEALGDALPAPSAPRKVPLLGDAVKAALTAVGVTEERVAAWVGGPCGCKERREKLNALDAWARGAASAAAHTALHALLGDAVPVPQVPTPPPAKGLSWSYGVMTVPARRATHLPRTLASLATAGFDAPRLFVDGEADCQSWRSQFGLEVTCRWPNLRTFGNWAFALAELYVRDPWAERFAVFQDDLVCCRDLRAYLDSCEYPTGKGYWNLYLFPKNEAHAVRQGREGWYESNQRGLGAVGLVFDREAVLALLTSRHMAERPLDRRRGWRAVDGGIVTAMNKAGYREMVHYPSLVQHTGDVSSMGNKPHPLAGSFRGEGWSPLAGV